MPKRPPSPSTLDPEQDELTAHAAHGARFRRACVGTPTHAARARGHHAEEARRAAAGLADTEDRELVPADLATP